MTPFRPNHSYSCWYPLLQLVHFLWSVQHFRVASMRNCLSIFPSFSTLQLKTLPSLHKKTTSPHQINRLPVVIHAGMTLHKRWPLRLRTISAPVHERGHLVAMERIQKGVLRLAEKSQSNLKVQKTIRTTRRDSPWHLYQDYIEICPRSCQLSKCLFLAISLKRNAIL